CGSQAGRHHRSRSRGGPARSHWTGSRTPSAASRAPGGPRRRRLRDRAPAAVRAYLSNEEREFHAGPTKVTVDPEGAKPNDPIGHNLVLVERRGNAGLATPIRGRSAHSR